MSEAFGTGYANIYDALYATKDYEREVNLIERILSEDGSSGSQRILDLGCGTGNHAIPLSRRGHTVVGVDRSSAMLTRAREKAATTLPADAEYPKFIESDVSHIDLSERFDAALMMFTVMGYLHEHTDLVMALKAVRRHLVPGGLFIFDVWNGLAVMADKPRPRSVTVADGTTQIVRKTRVELDELRHLCRVHFDLQRTDIQGEGSTEWTEEHVMRFYFPRELESALGDTGLDLLRLRSFPDYEAPPDERAWNIIGVARAR
jgi:SAM-dependent methyltransferase